MKDHETQKDGTQGAPPPKAKTGGEHDRTHKHADGHTAARPDILGDGRITHPANAEPLAGLLSQLQQSHGNAYVQRFVNESGGEKAHEAKTAPESHALDAGTRSQMESAFGENFGDVRVHTGGAAEKMNEEQGARAVTRGRDIYFGRGEYDSSSREGKELLAHELAHVVQQRGSSGSPQTNATGQAGDAFEQEADQAAASVLMGQRPHVENRSAAPAFQRQGHGPEAPSITHGVTLSLAYDQVERVSGTAGRNSWNARLLLTGTEGSRVDTLHITHSSNVSVSVVDLAGMNLRIQTAGRGVTIVQFDRKARGLRQLQLTFVSGHSAFIHTVQLPVSPGDKLTAAPPAAAPSGSGRTA